VINKFILILVLTLSIAGCCSTKPYKGMYISESKIIDKELLAENNAQIRVYRTSSFIGMSGNLDIYIDGQKITSLNNDSAQQININAGKHRIESKFKAFYKKSWCGFDFEISEGETIYIMASPSCTGTMLPIFISVLINPMACKSTLAPVEKENLEMLQEINQKIEQALHLELAYPILSSE
jgi:hypothetical protein